MAPSSNQSDYNLQRVIDALEGVQRVGAGWKARCPAHDDREPSLSVTERDDGLVLVNYIASCIRDAVLEALRDLGAWAELPGLTLGLIAEAKLLFVDVLRGLDVRDSWTSTGSGRTPPASIPYADTIALAKA